MLRVIHVFSFIRNATVVDQKHCLDCIKNGSPTFFRSDEMLSNLSIYKIQNYWTNIAYILKAIFCVTDLR